jgi:hypothetical protein
VGRDSVVGIATRYGLDGPGIESRWGRDFSQPSGAHPASFPGVNRPGRGGDHPTPSSARAKERVELYLYFPSGPSWSVLGRTLPLFWNQNRFWSRNQTFHFWNKCSKYCPISIYTEKLWSKYNPHIFTLEYGINGKCIGYFFNICFPFLSITLVPILEYQMTLNP